MTCRRPGGFTLLEVMVALVLTGVTALVAHGTLAGLLDARSRYTTARATLDREAEAGAWMTTVTGAVDVGPGRLTDFNGYPDSVSFGAFVPTAGGWMERRRVLIGPRDGALVLEFDGRTIPVLPGVAEVRFDYLVVPGLDGTFGPEWHTPFSAPVAIRIRATRGDAGVDTLIYAIGGRG